MERKASAVWKGDLKGGGGTISTESGVLAETPYNFSGRFADGRGTNPEEIIGAAHAGCFSMALSAILGEAGLTPDSVVTTATVTAEMVDEDWTVTSIHLTVDANVPGASAEAFQEAAEAAKRNCPISRLLNAEVTMEATLLS